MPKIEPFDKYSDRRNASVFYKDAVFYSALEVGGYLTEAGFSHVTCKQTLIPGEAQDMVQNGFGKGGFVAARGMKNA